MPPEAPGPSTTVPQGPSKIEPRLAMKSHRVGRPSVAAVSSKAMGIPRNEAFTVITVPRPTKANQRAGPPVFTAAYNERNSHRDVTKRLGSKALPRHPVDSPTGVLQLARTKSWRATNARKVVVVAFLSSGSG